MNVLPRIASSVIGITLSLLLFSGSAHAAQAPEVHGDVWLNSPPLTLQQLRGKVVIVEFWTYACWNCKNVEPHFKRWYEQYQAQGLEIIAVHTPEFDYEKEVDNVQEYVTDNGITYPVAMDNNFVTWKRYSNRAWPTWYVIDKQGQVRGFHEGEGAYAETQALIEKLLAEPKP